MKTLFIITGTTSGAGKNMAETFKSLGHDVYEINEDVDVREPEAVKAWFGEMHSELERYKDLYERVVLVNNAGVNHLMWAEDLIDNPEVVDKIIDTNVKGYVYVSSAFIKMIKALEITQKSRILFVGSVASTIPMTCTSVYGASKAADHQMARCLARELAPLGVFVGTIKPGRLHDTVLGDFVDQRTSELRDWSDDFTKQYQLNAIPLGDYINLDDISECVRNLAINAPMSQTGCEVLIGNGQM